MSSSEQTRAIAEQNRELTGVGAETIKRRLVTTAEVALMLDVSVYTVRRLVKRGKLVPICLGEQGEGHYRFDIEDVELLIVSSRRIRWR